MRALVGWCIITSLALTPATAAAQFFSGIAFEQGDPGHRVGVQIGTTLNAYLTPQLALRFDLAYVAFGKAPDQRRGGGPCPPPCSVQVTTSRLLLASGTASLQFMEQRDRNALYWMAGVGVYALSRANSGFGWNFGGGVRISRSVFVDVRYHRLIGANVSSFIPVKVTHSIIPVSFGIRF